MGPSLVTQWADPFEHTPGDSSGADGISLHKFLALLPGDATEEYSHKMSFGERNTKGKEEWEEVDSSVSQTSQL